MSQFKFVGIEAEIVGVARMDRFGQVVDLPDGMDAEAAAALLLPAAEFDDIFEGVDVAPYAMTASHDSAPADFQAAKTAAAIAVAANRSTTKGDK